jgi:hypothetical protein
VLLAELALVLVVLIVPIVVDVVVVLLVVPVVELLVPVLVEVVVVLLIVPVVVVGGALGNNEQLYKFWYAGVNPHSDREWLHCCRVYGDVELPHAAR